MSLSTTRKINTADVAAVIDEVDDILTMVGGYAVLMEAEMGPDNPNARDLEVINTLVIRATEVTKTLREVTAELQFTLRHPVPAFAGEAM